MQPTCLLIQRVICFILRWSPPLSFPSDHHFIHFFKGHFVDIRSGITTTEHCCHFLRCGGVAWRSLKSYHPSVLLGHLELLYIQMQSFSQEFFLVVSVSWSVITQSLQTAHLYQQQWVFGNEPLVLTDMDQNNPKFIKIAKNWYEKNRSRKFS